LSQSETEGKTEEPTEKRRLEALERDGGPFSREAGSAAILLAVALLQAAAGSSLIGRTAQQLAIFLEDPGGWRLNGGADAILLLHAATSAVSALLLPFAAAVVIAATAASVLQNVPRFIFNRIAPDVSRISPAAGFKRLFCQSAPNFDPLSACKVDPTLWGGTRCVRSAISRV
jgi:flagellar biosynthesis protein FlhB